MMKKMLLLAALVLMGAFGRLCGQTSTFKALFLYNFSINVDWQDGATDQPFVMTVVGDTDIQAELQKIAKVKKVGARSIVVKHVSSASEIGDTELIFLGASKVSQLSQVSSMMAGKPVLIVTDKDGLAKDGAAICFKMIDGKLRYEICQRLVDAHGIQVSQKVVSLGIEVQ